jgi:hypothetical protein
MTMGELWREFRSAWRQARGHPVRLAEAALSTILARGLLALFIWDLLTSR